MAEKPDFNDGSKWAVFPNIKVFQEHTRTAKTKDGQSKTIKFDKAKLERIAEKSNRRDEIGQPCPLVLGHTEDGKPETEQPDDVGYARHFKTVYDKDRKKWINVADYYIRREDLDEATKFKRTSVEVWADDEFFDPISLLKRTPQLDMGQWIYSRGGKLKLRYSMDDELHDDERDMGGVHDEVEEGPVEPDEEPREPEGEEEGHDGPEDVHPRDWETFRKCMKHHTTKYGMGDGGVAGKPKPKAAMPPKRDDGQYRRKGENARMRQDSESVRYARLERLVESSLKESRNAIEGLKAENQNLRYEREAAVCERMVSELETAGYHLDRATEVERMVGMSDDDRQRHVKYIRSNYRKAPVGGEPAGLKAALGNKPLKLSKSGERVAVRGNSNGTTHEPEPLDDAETDQVLSYMRENSLSGDSGWHEALKAVRGGRS